ncbi:hypothetical protein OIU85_015322 [Salix viminalis]|uniref:Uncharacterized protein n=1 Tax=Salix viminalis TaxID=40686 RepID=A0A9Q0NKU0_SALVM|nr:hypothetical protein OIU85_015322 [Salix viminalis]
MIDPEMDAQISIRITRQLDVSGLLSKSAFNSKKSHPDESSIEEQAFLANGILIRLHESGKKGLNIYAHKHRLQDYPWTCLLAEPELGGDQITGRQV